MPNEMTTVPVGADIERVLLSGDLSGLTEDQRLSFYKAVCESVGLNPLTNPFQYLKLNGKLQLYAAKNCTDQLRRIYDVSVTDLSESNVEGVYIVTAKVVNGKGRIDMAKGAVPIKGLAGEALSNAIMKTETKAKRRATLSICGLGMLDETEVDSIPGAVKFDRESYVEAKVAELKAPAVVTVPAPMPPTTDVTQRNTDVRGNSFHERVENEQGTGGEARLYVQQVTDAFAKDGRPFVFVEWGTNTGQSYSCFDKKLFPRLREYQFGKMLLTVFYESKKDKQAKMHYNIVRIVEDAVTESQERGDAWEGAQ